MSETEHWIGKAVPVPMNDGESLEELCERICAANNIEKPSWCDTYQEAVIDVMYKQMVIAGGVLYDVSDKKNVEYDDVCEASKDMDGSIRFHLKFYNGGTCLSEMLEEAVSKMEKSQ